MNIFFLDYNPTHAAKMHCNVHVLKMIIETAQLLSTAHWLLNPEETANIFDSDKDIADNVLYYKTHINHPCTLWVRENSANYSWAVELGFALFNEYKYRYEKNHHKTVPKLEWLRENYPASITKATTITKPALAMPQEYKAEDPVLAYRTYYLHGKYLKKEIFRKYKKRSVPTFLVKKDPSYGLHHE